jgi:hypothetical protein
MAVGPLSRKGEHVVQNMRMKKSLLLALLCFLTVQAYSQKTDKISVDDLVAKHLASIGDKDALAAATTRVMTGKGNLTQKVGAGTTGFSLDGAAQFGSSGRSVVYVIAFSNTQYPYEKLAFDGSSTSFGLPNGKTTLLGIYVKAQNSILKDGLLGGTLSSAWPLLDVKGGQKIKLEMAGMETIDGKQCYKVKYSSGRTGDLKVAMYFDADTFRHVRTDYLYTREPSIGTSPTDTQSTSRVERYHLVEDFSDFKIAGKLTLPMTHKITLTSEGQIQTGTGTTIREWTINFDNVYYDQKLGPEAFKVS